MKFKVTATNEQKSQLMREHRNKLLEESDKFMIEDFPVKNKKAWKDYRHALRNLTKDANWPDVELPSKPE